MTLPNILLASFVFLSWLSYSFSILTTEEPEILQANFQKSKPLKLAIELFGRTQNIFMGSPA
jgi:hypothetical protein